MANYFYLEQMKHLVLTQYHRWYQVYEIPFNEARIANQKDILDDQVVISSQNGRTKGKDGLEERLFVFEGWQNAHHVQNTEIKILESGLLSLEADILYQNIRPDGSKYGYTLHYSTQLRTRTNDLPLFTKVDLQPTGAVDEFQFEEAYPKNRVKSFLHYWLYLMECPDLQRFKELLNDDFTLNLSQGERIQDLSAFQVWLDQAQAQIQSSSHTYSDLQIEQQTDGSFLVRFDAQWRAIRRDHQKMIAETRHEWLLTNNPDERFSRMRNMQVKELIPFQIVSSF